MRVSEVRLECVRQAAMVRALLLVGQTDLALHQLDLLLELLQQPWQAAR